MNGRRVRSGHLQRKIILNIYKSADFPDLIFHKRGRNGQLNLLLVPFGNSCAVVCETIPATILFVKTYFENDRSRFQNTNQKIYSYKYAQSSAEGI